MPTKKKRKKNNSPIKKLIAALTAIVIIFSVLFVSAKTFGKVPLSGATDAFSSLTAEMGEFPYKVQSNSVVDIVPFGSGIAVIRSDMLVVLSKSGKVLLSVRHNYPTPAIDINNGRAILFDRGGTRYTVIGRTQILLEETQTSDKILDARMASDGKFAIAVTAKDVKSVLSVYNTSFEEIFRWKCVSEYITDIDFSDNAGKAAVTVTGVKSANPYSRLVMFDFKKSEPLMQKDFDSMMLFSVNVSGTVTTVTGDSYVCSLKKDGEIISEKSFSGDVLKSFSTEENGRSSYVLLKYGNERDAVICSHGKKGKVDFEISTNEKISNISRSNRYICVLTGDMILTYNNNGICVNENSVSETVRDICVSGSTLYILYSDRIEKISAA